MNLFNLFRKKKKHIQTWEYETLCKVIALLPIEYSYLKDQINVDFIIDSLPNELLKNGWKRIIINQNLYRKLKSIDINCKLTGISVYSTKSGDFENIELDLYEGVLIGYNFGIYGESFDLSRINIEHLTKVDYKNVDVDVVEFLLGDGYKMSSEVLDILDTIKIEIPQGFFYTIKNFGDGNYLAINEKGSIFGMFHEYNQIEKLFENPHDFFDAINSCSFNIEEYYEKKYKV